MQNPYAGKPNYAFWRRAVSGRAPTDVDPVTDVPFRISPTDRVATAGSCFAQHISRTLVSEGFAYLVTEPLPQTPGAQNENYGVFPARFGNVYTVRQLLQLMQRAYGLYDPAEMVWVGRGGAVVDPFRPRIQAAGFASVEELEADREAHLACVRRMFEACDIFVFTLGLTEGWQAVADGAVVPLAPGVTGGADQAPGYRFVNFDVMSMVADLERFTDMLREINPDVRIILTVSPVPLVATYEDRHVLVSTTYSKSALRVVVDMIARSRPSVAYFPSYEIITGPHAGAGFYEDDLREVRPEGVAYVMSLFRRHFLGGVGNKVAPAETFSPVRKAVRSSGVSDERLRMRELAAVICDEEAITEDLDVR